VLKYACTTRVVLSPHACRRVRRERVSSARDRRKFTAAQPGPAPGYRRDATRCASQIECSNLSQLKRDALMSHVPVRRMHVCFNSFSQSSHDSPEPRGPLFRSVSLALRECVSRGSCDAVFRSRVLRVTARDFPIEPIKRCRVDIDLARQTFAVIAVAINK